MMTSVRSSLMMCLDDAEVKRKHVEFMSNNPVPRLLFTIERYLKRMNQINTVDLYNVRETLCKGLKDEDMVNGKYRDPKLMLKIAQFHLSANN